MINGLSVLGVITARGGSKGLPRKNIVNVNGKPLISWTINSGKESKYIDRLILSTEDNEIAKVAEEFGCEVPFLRPEELASDTSSSYEVILHALEHIDIEYDLVVLLQPTSPLRSSKDIDACIELCADGKQSCVSIVQIDKPLHCLYTKNREEQLLPLDRDYNLANRRQDGVSVYAINGAVYVFRPDWFRRQNAFVDSETVAYLMPSARSLDIDTKADLSILEQHENSENN